MNKPISKDRESLFYFLNTFCPGKLPSALKLGITNHTVSQMNNAFITILCETLLLSPGTQLQLRRFVKGTTPISTSTHSLSIGHRLSLLSELNELSISSASALDLSELHLNELSDEEKLLYCSALHLTGRHALTFTVCVRRCT